MPIIANPIQLLQEMGQSVWLDGLQRDPTRSGPLHRGMRDGLISGVMYNSRVHCHAVSTRQEYADDIRSLIAGGASPEQVRVTLLLEDARAAAELMEPMYRRAAGMEGLVSVPCMTSSVDAELMTADARVTWTSIGRPNVLLEVPSTTAGMLALRRLVAAGINVNMAPTFSLERYRAILDALASGLEDRKRSGAPLAGIAVVTSFAINRIDALMNARLSQVRGPEMALAQRWLNGTAAALARFAYQDRRKFLRSARWQALSAYGAVAPRLLWNDTDAASPDDVRYVDALIGPDTITSLSPGTLAAYIDHGKPAQRLEDLTAVAELFADMGQLGIDLESVNAGLEAQYAADAAEGARACVTVIADLAGQARPKS
jgi:transaldolase